MVDFSVSTGPKNCSDLCRAYNQNRGLEQCNWWSWEDFTKEGEEDGTQLCLMFHNCTVAGRPTGLVCPKCVTGKDECGLEGHDGVAKAPVVIVQDEE